MSGRPGPGRATGVLLFLLLALLTACTQIPVTGPIEEVPVPDDPAGIEIAPRPPRGGDEPAQIVEGFLLALANPETDYQVARAYLAANARSGWDPGAATRIYDGAVVQTEQGTVLQGHVVGRIDAGGHYVADGVALAHDFGLVEEDGQWRISRPPEGVLVSRYLFERFYSPATIYFMDPAGRHVVPDLITVPTAELTPESVVRALIAGPSNGLVPVVSNAMPVDAKLGPEGATIDANGVVTVAFVGLDPSMDSDHRRRFGAQLLWSLTAIPRLSGLKVTNDGWPFSLPGQSAAGVLELATQQAYSVLAQSTQQDLHAVVDARPGTLGDDDRFMPLAAGTPPTAEIALSLSGQEVALLDDDRQSVWVRRGAGQFTRIPTGLAGVRSIQWVLGTLYGIGESASGQTQVLLIGADDQPRHTTIRLEEGVSLRHMTINPAGGVAAVITQRGEVGQLGRMTLTAAGALSSLQPIPVHAPSGATVTKPTDVEWNSESTLVLVGDSDRRQGIFVLRSDGSDVEELSAVDDGIVGLAALPRQGGGLIALRGQRGTVWRYSAPNRWSRAVVDASWIAYAG